MCTACDEMNITSGLGEARTKYATNTTSSHHRNFHYHLRYALFEIYISADL